MVGPTSTGKRVRVPVEAPYPYLYLPGRVGYRYGYRHEITGTGRVEFCCTRIPLLPTSYTH